MFLLFLKPGFSVAAEVTATINGRFLTVNVSATCSCLPSDGYGTYGYWFVTTEDSDWSFDGIRFSSPGTSLNYTGETDLCGYWWLSGETEVAACAVISGGVWCRNRTCGYQEPPEGGYCKRFDDVWACSELLPFDYHYCEVPCVDNDGDGYIACRDDCNDSDAAIYPNAQEVCNGADNNCDGQIDEGVLNTYYQDADGDGFGNPAVTSQSCTAPPGYVADNTDCNDNDPLVYPENGVCCPVPHLTPLTDPLAIRMEGGDKVIFDGLTTEMLQAWGCFDNKVFNAGGQLIPNSAYRPPQYQQHLREVWDRYRDLMKYPGSECNALRNQITADFNSHQPMTKRPGQKSRHSEGIAIDATITPPVQDVDTLADNCDLYRPLLFMGEPWHFELRR